MGINDKEHKKNHSLNRRPIISLLFGLGVFTVIMLVTVTTLAVESKKKHRTVKTPTQKEDIALENDAASGTAISAIVKEVNLNSMQVTLYDIKKREDKILTYNGATNVIDKYKQVIAISQIEKGTLVEARYIPEENKLTDMQISPIAWEYVGVSNFTIDRSDRVMKIASTKYKYNDDVYIQNGDKIVPISTLAEQDELIVRGYEETIWSITVTRGHGTVKLVDYEQFLGAHIEIGYEAIQQITEDMIIPVREGNFNLTVSNGKFSATKNVTVVRDEETTVSLGDIGPDALKQGRITFVINPFGADLFIDGELVSYANPIELTYGEHKISASLGGYTTYDGILNVKNAGMTIKIDLPESTSDKQVVVSETETIPGTNVITADDTLYNDSDSESADSENTDETEPTPEPEEDGNIDKDHKIYVQKPIGASVYLNGEFMGISPVNFEKIIGTHVITFIESGYETKSYTITVEDDGMDTYINMPNLIPLLY